jgi:hypothetical protein
MLKDVRDLLSQDPYYAAGFIGSSMEALHADMSSLELPEYVPKAVRRYHNGIRNAYVYSYFFVRSADACSQPDVPLHGVGVTSGPYRNGDAMRAGKCSKRSAKQSRRLRRRYASDVGETLLPKSVSLP